MFFKYLILTDFSKHFAFSDSTEILTEDHRCCLIDASDDYRSGTPYLAKENLLGLWVIPEKAEDHAWRQN